MLKHLRFRLRRHRFDCLLAVNLGKADRRLLGALSEKMSWRLICAENLAAALQKAEHPAVRVVLCERDLPDGNWKDLFEHVRDLPHTPKLIVTSRLADEHLWAEVLNLGGHDVLLTPFFSEEVVRVVSCAMSPPLFRSRVA